ncbi:chromosomal replication initiator protein DnaA [Acetanaerobacterium sp. MSJ-12]|uniref:Chromosomal replication initiator protein DnaA n=1 Tax=Bittarella massiliensis (ex Durand et al. 2017) TaxID=1720313 RepID=A0AAQ1RVK0_9FIRM|nr:MULTISPECIES: chromosomal replication initiator protein DnaA [Eubacteriales]MCB5942185.1 chromosomal replication initiator protein DnaA [bacterium 210820-DFI.6.52]ERJ00913.1 replication initiator protein DnaA [Clostridium sp. ATCC 29733]MBC2872543.1 chromosomal replication initiator protein DnaA [Bittarella massiliensis (ex Durand et al. 2017)]MBU5420941.1 chromosomal replication initiator protein DnaA [Acetanaerobacterium sp. MSJ-12]MCQ4948706.1 chromosomal replication initiator protein Dn
MDSFSDVWELVAHHCKTQLSDMVYDLWIKCIEPVKLENDTALLYVRSKFQQDLINEKYLEIIKQGFESVLGFPVAVQITCDAMVKGDGAAAKEENKQPEEALNQVGIGGDYDYTFASFIVGSSNNFAHAAAMAVAANPSNVYNPLFIYGDSGLGKTHLLFAICNEVKKNNPQANIVYVKGEEFTNEMISAIGSGTTMEFRNKYRVADVLLIDDIQFIGGKISTQEEFFHTFETLFQSHKQIVLSSDRPPKEIKTLEDRLRSRFESGLLADIQPPDFETRIAIIRRKAELLGLDLPSDVTEFIANRIKNNIRQLEGAVKKINAYKMLEGISPTVAVAHAAIKDILNDNQPIPVTVERIISEVSRTFNVSPQDIKSKKKSADVSQARQVAIYVIREVTQMPMKNIGEELGGRDHSTIVYSLNEMKSKLKKNQRLQETINDIIKNIKK